MIHQLSILICTIPEREVMFDLLLDSVIPNPDQSVQILFDESIKISIGGKRNRLLAKAKGKYVCFIDDDDQISPNYLKWLLKAADSGCDCASLKGEYSVDGKFDGIFEHSIRYKEWRTTDAVTVKYERYPNHLNMIRASIAKQFKFPETNHGEDYEWSKQIHESGLLKTEYYIPEVIYYYLKTTKNVQPT